MSNLVIRNQTLASTIGEGMTFHSRNDAIDGIINFRNADAFLATSCRKDRRFVQQIGKVCPCKTRSPSCNAVESKGFFELFVS